MTDGWQNRVLTGDAFDVLPTLPADSVHAVVTDPPYGLNFMGKDWDNFRRKRNEADAGRENVFGRTSSTSHASGAETEGKRYQAWCEEWAHEVKRVLKPGGHLLAFSGNRTHHRLFSGVEDAGFEIRDTITWHYGSGFPKALDVSKAIDKAAGRADERETIRTRTDSDISGGNVAAEGAKDTDETVEHEITAPATDAAERWDGFKTALKPATEYVVVARKPFDGTVAENVQTHGTGALNIDECRVDTVTESEAWEGADGYNETGEVLPTSLDTQNSGLSTEGRYPSNVVFDEVEAERLDRAVGELDAGARTPQTNSGSGDIYVDYSDETRDHDRRELSSGGPSRYFYTSKASKAERTEDGSIENDHPTVKPLDLTEWLVKLVTAEGQAVLDPFAGSGTIPKAAKQLGRQFVGIERQAKCADVARVRCGLTPEDPAHVREDDRQRGLEVFGE
jgi:DNA modification methylase